MAETSLKSHTQCSSLSLLTLFITNFIIIFRLLSHKILPKDKEIPIERHFKRFNILLDFGRRKRGDNWLKRNTFLLSLSQVAYPLLSTYCRPKNQISRKPIVFTTYTSQQMMIKALIVELFE